MYRNILPKLNFGIFLLIAMAAAVVQSTIFGYTPLNFVQPDIILITVIYFGFRRTLIEGGIFVLLAAIIMEQHSGAGNNYFLAAYTYIFMATKVISRLIVVPSMLSTISIVAALTLLERLGLLLLTHWSGGNVGFVFRHLFVSILPGILIQVIFTPICFSWFMNIDLKTFKDEHAEDEYDINKGF